MKTIRNIAVAVAVQLFVVLAAMGQEFEAPPSTPPANLTFNFSFSQGWTLAGNALKLSLVVADVFGSKQNPTGATWAITSVYAWDAKNGRWLFYSPVLDDGGKAYAATKDYGFLEKIAGGQGFWVNAKYGVSLADLSGEAFVWTWETFSALPDGFNLIAITGTPQQFNRAVAFGVVQLGEIPLLNFKSFWTWESYWATWSFYAPSLDASGDWWVGENYAKSKGYINATGQQYQPGTGAWVYKLPQTPPTPTP